MADKQFLICLRQQLLEEPGITVAGSGWPVWPRMDLVSRPCGAARAPQKNIQSSISLSTG